LAMERSVFAASGQEFRTKNISQRAQSMVLSPIKEMMLLAEQVAKETPKDIVSFGQGVPYLDTPEYIKVGITKALREKDTARYTSEPGIPELRELIARDLQQRKGIAVNPENEVIVTTGCQEAIMCALTVLIDEGDEVIVLSPSFASYSEQILQLGSKPIFVSLEAQNNWRLNIKAAAEAVTPKTKAILFSHPSNPTGTVFSQDELRALADIAKEKDLVIITDETYDFLTYDGIEHVSPITFEDMKDRVILCGSFSKKYSLTGYRVGYAVAEQGFRSHMLKVHDTLAICAPAISQKAAIAALRGSQEHVADLVEKMTANREYMAKKLDEMSDFFEYVKPEGAYYILAKYKIDMPSIELAVKILKETHVITIPGIAFGPAGENHLRFSFACSPQEIDEGFSRLQTWVKTL
jgi:aminotransferase